MGAPLVLIGDRRDGGGAHRHHPRRSSAGVAQLHRRRGGKSSGALLRAGGGQSSGGILIFETHIRQGLLISGSARDGGTDSTTSVAVEDAPCRQDHTQDAQDDSRKKDEVPHGPG